MATFELLSMEKDALFAARWCSYDIYCTNRLTASC